ncbi:MAG: ion transporter [bacterium]
MSIQNFQLILYRFISTGRLTKVSIVFNRFIIILIMLNIFAFALETEPSLSQFLPFLAVFEYASLVIFTIEYFLRLFVCRQDPVFKGRFGYIRYFFSFHALIDLLALLPFYIPFIMHLDFRALRVFRLLRLLQLFKLEKYMMASSRLSKSFSNRKEELFITAFLSMMILLILSIVMYYVEGSVQPEKFSSVSASLWWAISTLTTIGYGDIYPMTGLGRFISGIVAMMGIGLIMLPTSIFGASLVEHISHKDTPKDS